MTGALSVAIVGGSEERTAYAAINRVWTERLRGAGYDAHLVPSLAAIRGASFDRVIHHDYQDHFAALVRPEAGRFLAVRTWDFGPFPRRWAEIARDVCDELWVHSRWTAGQAAAGGIDPAKVHVVPHGIDTVTMRPGGPRFPFAHPPLAGDPERMVFLFVGAAVLRKGVDILLEAYGRAFDAGDRVTLVIKDHSRDVFYEGIGLRDRIDAFRERAGAPDLLYLDAYLDPPLLAALYRSSNACVFPYRAEGFALPILEGMACGTPPIVPRFGACLDFCDDDSAFFVAARRIRLPVARNLQFNTLGFREEVEEVDFCEIDPGVLADEMRRVARLPREARAAAGRAAARQALAFSWDATLVKVCERLSAS